VRQRGHGDTGRIGIVNLPVKTGRERWLEWAAASQWTFRSYYKYTFVFTATESPLSLPDGAQENITATVAVGGQAHDIYRYTVTAEPLNWIQATCGGDWELTVSRADGSFLFACASH
jgi:hypothetical protein